MPSLVGAHWQLESSRIGGATIGEKILAAASVREWRISQSPSVRRKEEYLSAAIVNIWPRLQKLSQGTAVRAIKPK